MNPTKFAYQPESNGFIRASTTRSAEHHDPNIHPLLQPPPTPVTADNGGGGKYNWQFPHGITSNSNEVGARQQKIEESESNLLLNGHPSHLSEQEVSRYPAPDDDRSELRAQLALLASQLLMLADPVAS